MNNQKSRKNQGKRMEHRDVIDITIMLPAGRLPVALMKHVADLAEEHGFSIYLSTLQNLRMLDVPKDKEDQIKQQLAPHTITYKKAGQFPIPRICIGTPHCKLGTVDTEKLSATIISRYKNREATKAKLKIAIAGCVLSCSGKRSEKPPDCLTPARSPSPLSFRSISEILKPSVVLANFLRRSII